MSRAKKCSKCQETKPLSDFYTRVSSPDGKRNECKDCIRSSSSSRYYNKVKYENGHMDRSAWREKVKASPNSSKRSQLLYRYGMTLEEYELLLKRQGGGCGICGSPPKRVSLAVDHDHRCCPAGAKVLCGKCIRGLLCTRCNSALGVYERHVSEFEQWRDIRYVRNAAE